MTRLSSQSPSPQSEHLTLVFDLMDTVVVDPFFADLPRRFGSGMAALGEARDPTAWPAFERGELTEDEFLSRLYPTGCPEGAPTPIELRDTIVGSYRFVPGMRELLSALHHEGHALWVLSNYPVWINHARKKLALDELFTGLIASWQLRARKPELEAYERAAAEIGETPDRLLLIDDRERNCEGARAAGWRALRFESALALEDALRAYGFCPEAG
jgi:HAD superfamily hydrolase (TIGR01509 family)